jgi:cytochrome c oxidase subunit IV
MTTDVHDTAAEHVAAEVKVYMAVFGALLLLTLITVGVSYLSLPHTPTVIVALSIAVTKAALVALFFMHLKRERAMVYWPLALTATFFLALIAFVLWTEGDHLFGTRFTGPFGKFSWP